MTQAQARYSRSEIRLARQLDVAAVRKEIDDLARQRREVDTAIQEQIPLTHRHARTATGQRAPSTVITGC